MSLSNAQPPDAQSNHHGSLRPMITIELPVQRSSHSRRAVKVSLVAASVIAALLVVAPPATPDQLRAIYLASVVFFGLHAASKVVHEWLSILRGGKDSPIAQSPFGSRAMRLIDTLVGSVLKLFFGALSVPLFIVVAVDLISTAKRFIGGV